MAEYIEREAVKDELLSWAVCIKHPEHLLKEDALHVIDSIAAADVEPVVRCKDCKFYNTIDWDGNVLCGCNLKSGMVDIKPDGYCSYGERKGGDGNG